MGEFDILFVGHVARDHVCHHGREPVWMTGGSLMYGSIAAARAGARVAAVTRMAEADRELLSDMDAAGVVTTIIPVPETTVLKVVYPTRNVEVREIYQPASAGDFGPGDVPGDLQARCIHLAGNAGGEFPLSFMQGLKERCESLSLDMQGFVRQRDPETDRVEMKDVPDKEAIFACLDKVKLDIVEAEILTGAEDPASAAAIVEGWGCPEVIVTQTVGVLCRHEGEVFFEKFTNRGLEGRNGRGDTTFAGYLARRLTHGPEDALKFAAAVASIKLEKRGPFSGTLEDVLARMSEA